MFGTALMRIAYGFDDMRQNEALIDNVEALIFGFLEAVVPGRYLVNHFPALKSVPSWFPGAGFQATFKRLSQLSIKTLYTPFEEAKSDFVGPLALDTAWTS
jgi:hypothetical protein